MVKMHKSVEAFQSAQSVQPGAHQMEPPSPLIS